MGLFDDDLFGGFFDLDGDGKTSLDEEFIAYDTLFDEDEDKDKDENLLSFDEDEDEDEDNDNDLFGFDEDDSF